MSGLQIFQFLLSAIHILGLLATVSCTGYCLWVWLSGRLESASMFPYPEFELAGGIMTTALSAAWLSALPAALFAALEPASYFSKPGMLLLALFTAFNCAAIGLIHHRRSRLDTQNRVHHLAFRTVFSGAVACSLMIPVLFLPWLFLAREVRYLDANSITGELLTVFLLLYVIVFALSLTMQDRWLTRHRRPTGGANASNL